MSTGWGPVIGTNRCHYCDQLITTPNPPGEGWVHLGGERYRVAREYRRGHRDHRTPRARGGGRLGPDNLVRACAPCNIEKRDRPYIAFLFGEAPDKFGPAPSDFLRVLHWRPESPSLRGARRRYEKAFAAR